MDLAQELRADEGEVVKVVDQQRRFLGMAYVGFQNKGVAWVYSREEDEALDDAFFSGIFKTAFENDVRYYIRKIRRHSVSSMGKATALEA